MNIQVIIHHSFLVASLLYLISLIMVAAKQKTCAACVFAAGMICHAGSLALRYWTCFPLLPLYQGPFFLAFAVGLIGFRPVLSRSNLLSRIVLVNLLSWSAYLFPNDFYLPFLQFKTLFAHGFFLLGVVGKSLFLLAGAGAVMVLLDKGETGQVKFVGQAVLWGFFFWTLSVFSGAFWSWLGWGSPVVWDDPLMTTTMATWLLYSLMLHLHLTRFSGAGPRAWFALLGAVWVFCFNCVPELGPFRIPGWLS
ncbi:cytochrome C assembly family protein [Desulfobacula toluolica]|nr:hypothetical protein [Desulfobacula toluolica]